ncbi:hypothetical protein CWS72_16730 [Telmatospirillum siberiense]|uniref:SnoaL-like domain-containing protein n=2 Tax=Telmatospirillum siberiense TaxID=382514 RepID=A0A2N3PT00_9PROT|nr:hypothetical protein CWS72_16730 [Telmatospirillum siberiense]
METLLLTYILAKDGNRPHLLRRAFAEDARLEMVVNTGAISFPPIVRSREDIADVLVRQFGAKYENIYTFCLDRPEPDDRSDRFSCRWAVGMTEKATGVVRVGYGDYEWRFSHPAPRLVEYLRITIETMVVLPDSDGDRISDWLSGLPYPWCAAATFVKTAPGIAALRPVMDGLKG